MLKQHDAGLKTSNVCPPRESQRRIPTSGSKIPRSGPRGSATAQALEDENRLKRLVAELGLQGEALARSETV